MEMKKYFEQELAKSPKLHKAKYNLQWDIKFQSAHVLQMLRIQHGLTQAKLARKMKAKQPAVARSEACGCSLDFLNRAAKAVGKKLTLLIEEPEPLS